MDYWPLKLNFMYEHIVSATERMTWTYLEAP